MSKYLQETLARLIEQGAVSDDPIAELRRHTVLGYMIPAVDEIYDGPEDGSQDLAELVAALTLLAYQEGVEIGWDKHKQTVREMDGAL